MRTSKRNRILSLLLVIVMLMTLMPMAVFAEESSVTATKVTAAPEDWSGDYLIVYGDKSYAFDGSRDNSSKKIDDVSNYQQISIDGDTATAPAGINVTLEKTEGGYLMKTASGKYIYAPSDKNNTISVTDNASTAAAHPITVSLDDEGFADIVCEGTHLRFNNKLSNGTLQNRFRFYKSSSYDKQQAITLYKLGEAAEPKVSHVVTDLTELTDGAQIVIFNPANGKAMTSEYKNFYNQSVDVTLADGKLSHYTEAAIWTVGVTDDGYTFSTADGNKLSMDTGYTSMPLDKVNDTWTISAAATEGCFYIQNPTRKATIEYQPEYNSWSTYYTITTETEALFAQQIYLVVEEESGDDTPSTGNEILTVGSQIVIYNQNAKGVLSLENDTDSITNVSCEIVGGKAVPANGGVVFTVEKNGDYYRFKNDAYGYLCSNGTGNNAFYSKDFSEEGVTANDADWLVRTCSGGVGGFEMESRTAKYNGVYSQWLEYYADSYKTYSMYKVTDYTIYSFYFYPVDDGVTLVNGVVQDPKVVFNSESVKYKGIDYSASFTLDDLAENITSIEIKVNGTALKASDYTVDGNTYTFTVANAVDTLESFDIEVSVKNSNDLSYTGKLTVSVSDEISFSKTTPSNGSETGEDKKPVISVALTNAGINPTVTMTVNGTEVTPVYTPDTDIPECGVVSYTPAKDMEDGKVNVTVTVKRADGKTGSVSWFFNVGKAQYQLYFGQLHSHTGEYSDGSGTLSDALKYVKNLPDSANVDFVAFTDHSNYFDSTSSANPEGALYDMSLASASSREKWAAYKSAVAKFNEENAGDLVAIAGFEMTWSGGPGHINTFNTPGIVSRNNSTLNNKTNDSGMKAYYALLSQTEGADSISQFNHPGTTFGNFTDFSYWDAVSDSRINLVEVGNGEGQIGAGGYYPSYEQYIMALDKGWHVAPTNNQDNHKGKWGNANDARDVILTDNFTEEGIYQAMRDMRIYATEDKNLEIYYTVNGQQLGSQIEEVPETLDIDVQVYDPDSSDSITKVEVVVNSGKTAYTWDDPAVLATGHLTVSLPAEYSYYFIRVTQGDGDLAVTAPVWVGESLKLGISSVESGTSTPVTDEELTITTTLFNSEAVDATVTSIVYTVNGSKVIGTDTTGYTIAASGTATVDFKYTPTEAKLTKITVTVNLKQDGKDYTFTKDIELDVLDADSLVYIGIDASHYNEYVAGNYSDSMGNFGELAASYSVRTVELKTSEDLIAACSNDKYKALILTAPSRRLEAAQADPKTYSAAELAAIAKFNAAGGTVILAGWSDHYELYDAITSNPDVKHMAATQNEILAALGSSIRISDDATYDDVYSAIDGCDAWRLHFNTYGESFLTDGVIFDADHPYDRLYTEVFSHYGGASIYTVDANGNPTTTVPSTVSPIVYAHNSTYSVDVDKDGLGGTSTPKYLYAEGDERLMVMASEQIGNNGLIIVSGAAFMSNFEVQATVEDNGSEKNYSNYKICENLLSYINPVKITPIAEVQKQTETGYKYTIEGVVTTNASGYDKDTAFFDCIYVQDKTGGICCFPIAGNYKIGDIVRITGTTDFYQGEMELQTTSIEKIGETDPLAPTAVTAAQINDGSVLGSFISIKGIVQSFEYENGLIQTIMVKDAEGNVARVFIDGYICKDKDVQGLEVGKIISVSGIASYDDTFAGVAPRIRINDRSNIVLADEIFTDVTEAHWAYDAIVRAAKAGIVNGMGDGTFLPNETITRAQFVTIIWNYCGGKESDTELSFTDADSIKPWYKEAVEWAVENGIIKGYEDNTFRPENAITREEMATVAFRLMTLKGFEAKAGDTAAYPFTDSASIQSYAADAINVMANNGILTGYKADDGSFYFGPQLLATRAEATVVVMRIVDFLAALKA